MKKFLAVILTVGLLGIFVLVMQSGNFFKRANNPQEDLEGSLASLEELVDMGDWKSAYQKADELENVFRKLEKKMQFSEERDRIDDLTVSLARIKGYIKGEDKGGSVAEIKDALTNWEDIGG